MPHTRKRLILDQFQKKVAFSRVITLQGCRQSGKSFLARELLPEVYQNALYLTFDRKQTKVFAEKNPESFLKKNYHASPLILDEAQKVPDIFDAIKYEVDLNPKPGQYILLGSTEFSKLVRIREGLTGRMSRVRLYPLTAGECLELELHQANPAHLFSTKSRANRTQILKHLDRGGFPGIFEVRDDSARNDLFEDWIQLTLTRDLHQFPGISVDTELASDILRRIPLLDEPNATQIAKALKKDTRTVQRILNLFETLFVIHRLTPFREGNGKPLYFLCDVGLATYLGANFEVQLWTWLLQEQLAQRGFLGDSAWKLNYFRSPKGKFLHLILENVQGSEITAIKILSTEHYDTRDLELLTAFLKRVAPLYKQVKTLTWGPGDHEIWNTGTARIENFPWEALI